MLQKNIRRYKIIEKHIELVRNGQYIVARNLFWLLREGYVELWLGDADYETECFLESIGCPVSYGRNGYTATFRV